MSEPVKIPVLNAMSDPTHRDRLELIIGAMRAGLAPILNQSFNDEDLFALDQSLIISGAAILAGMTIGHMTFFGAMRPNDQKRAQKVVAVNLRNGIKFGLDEARRAAEAQGQMQ